ncbi:MAG: ABC transporter permease [Microthrixaceae bacterium]
MTLTADPSGGARSQSTVVQVFEPNALTLPSLRGYTSELSGRWPFIAALAGAEVRGQRSSTFLGELWSLVDPLFQAAIYWFLFTVIRGTSGGGTSTEYVTAIIGSVFLFNYTRVSISDGGRAIVRHKGLVLNAVFPRALLPIAEVYKGFLSTLPALAVYAIAHVALRAPITQAILLLPLLFAIQTVINLGLALIFSTATAYFKDVSNLLNYVVRLLTFATPVVYPVATLSPSIKQLLSWNPLFALFSSFQGVITGQMPTAGMVLQSAAWATLLFATGVWVFLRHERSFALHV